MSEASEIEAAAEAREDGKAWEAIRAQLTARQWEHIAASQQYRLFAIHDLAVKLNKDQPDYRAIVAGRLTAAEQIRDLCRLPHDDLVKAGLLK